MVGEVYDNLDDEVCDLVIETNQEMILEQSPLYNKYLFNQLLKRTKMIIIAIGAIIGLVLGLFGITVNETLWWYIDIPLVLLSQIIISLYQNKKQMKKYID